MTAVQLIVGLGNPGPEYDQTRHNAGPFSLSAWRMPRASASWLTAVFRPGRQVQPPGQGRSSVDPDYLYEPQRPVRGGAGGILPDRPGRHPGGPRRTRHAPGVAKLKTGGGHGGHNGLRDIIAQLGNQNSFHRLRLGIGHPGHSSLVSGYVLGRAPRSEQELLDTSIDFALGVLPEMLAGDWTRAMQKLHSQKA